MSIVENGIDHVIVGVRDLEAARTAYARLGFTPTPRGSHIGWGTANYCIMFADDYLELLGVVDPAKFTNNLDAFLDEREGLLGLAFATDDAVALKAGLADLGIAAEGPRDLARNLELPEGTVQPAFKLVFPEASAMPGLAAPAAPFFCQHLSPEMIRRPAWLDHANGAIGIASVTAVVEAPTAHAGAYRALFGADAVAEEDGRLTVDAAGFRIHLVSPVGLDALHPGQQPDPALDPPYLMGMAVAVDDPARAAACLSEAGVASRAVPGGGLAVAPPDAAGLWLEFVPSGG